MLPARPPSSCLNCLRLPLALISNPFRAYSSRRTTPRSALYSRIVPLANHPCAVLDPELDAWAANGRVLPADLQFMLRELRKRNRHQQALQISEWMHKKGISFMPRDHAVHLDLIGSVRGSAAAETYFDTLANEIKIERTYGALLNCYVRERLLDKSLSHMKKMKELGFACNALTYNDIMCLYTNTGQHDKVPFVLAEMKKNQVLPDNFSYRICIHAYGALTSISKMEEVLDEMENQPHIVVDWNTYAVVAYMYIKAGLVDEALIALKKSENKMNEEDSLCYNHLISLYGHVKNKSQLQRLWETQKFKLKKLTNRDYMTMIWALAKVEELERAEALLNEWESSSNSCDFRVPNILLAEYCAKGLMEKADAIVQGFVKKGKIPPSNSWGILAKGFTKKGEFNKAYHCMEKALSVHKPNSGWEPNPKVVASIFKGLNLVDVNIPENSECVVNSNRNSL